LGKILQRTIVAAAVLGLTVLFETLEFFEKYGDARERAP